MTIHSLTAAIYFVLGGILFALMLVAGAVVTPGSALVNMISIDADGRHGILVRTVRWAVIGDWVYEVETAEGKRICDDHGTTLFEDRGEKPVIFPLEGDGCDRIAPGDYQIRASVSPRIALWVNLRPTVIEASFTVE